MRRRKRWKGWKARPKHRRELREGRMKAPSVNREVDIDGGIVREEDTKGTAAAKEKLETGPGR